MLFAVPMRVPEVQLHIPNPALLVVHVTLKRMSSKSILRFRNDVVGHASFPGRLAVTPDGSRKSMTVNIADYDGKATGVMVLRMRVQERGVFVEDWVSLGQGARSFDDVPATPKAAEPRLRGLHSPRSPRSSPLSPRRFFRGALGPDQTDRLDDDGDVVRDNPLLIGAVPILSPAPKRIPDSPTKQASTSNAIVTRTNPLMLLDTSPPATAKAGTLLPNPSLQPSPKPAVAAPRATSGSVVFGVNPLLLAKQQRK